MNKDIQLFRNVINHLVYLTTTDEFGYKRSRGVGTFEHYAEELNDQGLLPDSGGWTENSLKLFFSRIKRKYPKETYEDECDLDFIHRSHWEYLSYSKAEEVIEPRNSAKHNAEEYEKKDYKPNNSYTALYLDIDSWKSHEKADIERQDKNILKTYKKNLKLRHEFRKYNLNTYEEAVHAADERAMLRLTTLISTESRNGLLRLR